MKRISRSLIKIGVCYLATTHGYDNLNHLSDSSEELLVLTLGGERSPEVYAFSPLSLQETKLPNTKIARKAGGAM